MKSLKVNRIEAVVLAAGKSGRIGYPKSFLNFKDRTFISEIITKLNHFCDKIIVVFGFNSEAMMVNLLNDKLLKPISSKLVVEINENYEQGMFSSLQCGISKTGDCNFILIHHIDQPQLPMEFYFDLINQLENDIDWLQPSFEGKQGHPLIISKNLAKKILIEDMNSNLRDFQKKNDFIRKKWVCAYPQILQDIDTQKDYENLMRNI